MITCPKCGEQVKAPEEHHIFYCENCQRYFDRDEIWRKRWAARLFWAAVAVAALGLMAYMAWGS